VESLRRMMLGSTEMSHMLKRRFLVGPPILSASDSALRTAHGRDV
jgi:hypothetical protein